jgi:arabinoxylan arabinofuranohydrolase
VFSSDDLIHWKAYRNVFTSGSVNDPERKALPLYAPDCVKINDTYYLFYCQEGGCEGIAESKVPQGPFTDLGPLLPADKTGIDPSVFVDDDGKVYYFWGQISLNGGELDLENRRLVDSTVTRNIITDVKDGFHEGSSIRKRNGIYYLVYSDISRGRPTCMGYATSLHPLGPYVKRGIIIDNTGCDPQSWNDHGSIAEINGNWYVFYHRSTQNSFFSRHVCMEPIHFNPDGTIDEVEMTSQGVEGPLDAFSVIDAYRACLLSGKCYVDAGLVQDVCVQYINGMRAGDTITFKYLDFSDVPEGVSIRATVSDKTEFKLYIDDSKAEAAGIKVSNSPDFQDCYGKMRFKVTGKHSITLKMFGGSDTAGKILDLHFTRQNSAN